jgi:putative polyketide hydroxylase
VLCAGPDGRAWREALCRSTRGTELGVVHHGIAPAGDLQDVHGRWSAAYGVDADGAVLIRPDGFVAWRRRTPGADAQTALDAAFEEVIS